VLLSNHTLLRADYVNVRHQDSEAHSAESVMTTSTTTFIVTQRVLLTRATGYIGGRLLKSLEKRGCRVRCLARRPAALKAKAGPSTEIVAGDVLDRPSLDEALRGVDVAYYLVHSMGSDGSFEQVDRQAARHFGESAKAAGVSRIIYLGGLGNIEEALSAHLRSRHEVGSVLRESGVPVIEFRASIIISSGSLSFEMIRSLVERLPIMITPKWVHVPAQPIAIDDVLEYLVAALQLPLSQYQVYEIGGADVVSHADIMRAYARQRGIRLRIISVPVLTPYVSSLWLGLIRPLYANLLRLAAEMKLPGRAWLEFEVTGDGTSATIRQTATFDPVGLLGRAYWYALFPLHHLVFGGMLRGIARAALREGTGFGDLCCLTMACSRRARTHAADAQTLGVCSPAKMKVKYA